MKSAIELAMISVLAGHTAACTWGDVETNTATDGAEDTDGGESTSETGTSSSSSSSSETSETDTSGTDDQDSFFVPRFDSNECGDGSGSACDPFAQDCPDGEKCVAYVCARSYGTRCNPVTGDGAVGESCVWGGPEEATDDCSADSFCWDAIEIDGQLIGVCTPFCSGSADMPVCPPSTSCNILHEGSVVACIGDCNPLLQDCAPDHGCFPADPAFSCIYTAGEIAIGEPCGLVNDCAPGSFCVSADVLPACSDDECCTPYCDLGDPVCDALPGTECVAMFAEGMAPSGYEAVGICALPG